MSASRGSKLGRERGEGRGLGNMGERKLVRKRRGGERKFMGEEKKRVKGVCR